MKTKHIDHLARTRLTRASALGLAAIIGLMSFNLSAQCAPPAQAGKKAPTLARKAPPQAQRAPLKAYKTPPVPREDLVLVMPDEKANPEELNETLAKVKGKLIGHLGTGNMKVFLIQAEHGKAAEVARKLDADKKHFGTVEANTPIYANTIGFQPEKEPGGDSWHIKRMHLLEALKEADSASSADIAILDSGCQGPEVYGGDWGCDVTGDVRNIAKMTTGWATLDPDDDEELRKIADQIHTFTHGLTDMNGHGTGVASAAAGRTNGIASFGVNPQAGIIPMKIADGPLGAKISADPLSIVTALMCLARYSTTKIVNISYGPLQDFSTYKVIHKFFKDFHDRKGGLIFISAGNDGEIWAEHVMPYLNVVSAMGDVPGMHLVDVKGSKPWQSARGDCITFTAPGQNIKVSNPDGTQAIADGTSFASPICAGIASLIWAVNPRLTNTQVESIMRQSCANTTTGWNSQFGYGMPDALKAVRLAKRGV